MDGELRSMKLLAASIVGNLKKPNPRDTPAEGLAVLLRLLGLVAAYSSGDHE